MAFLAGFLSEAEIAQALVHAATAVGFEPGRQGTGYEKHPLAPGGPLDPLVARLRGALPSDANDAWDAYLLRYRDGAYVPPHVDPIAGGAHVRLNVLLRGGQEGSGGLYLGGDRVALLVGDAVRFRSDRVIHEVREVRGERLVLSVGCLVA